MFGMERLEWWICQVVKNKFDEMFSQFNTIPAPAYDGRTDKHFADKSL